MDTEKMSKMFKLVEKAKLYEKMGKEDMALNIYLEIHSDYYPNTSNLFDRPIVLLEKRRRLVEAKEMCEKAISLAASNKITGTPEHFQKRLDRINEKLEGNKDTPKEDDSSDKEKESENKETQDEQRAKLASPEEKKPKENGEPPKFFIPLIAVVTVIGLFFMVRYNINQSKEKEMFKDMYVDTLKMFSNQGPSKGKSIFKQNPDPGIPDISYKAIEKTVEEINKEPGVLESYVMINADAIGLILKVDPLISVEESKAASEKFAKRLSFYAAQYNERLNPADLNGYGKLYSYYSAYLLNKPNKDIIISEGSISKNSSKIFWKNIKP